jgi:UDP-N-acetylmuramoylalanine--D-glutamate ligase
VLPRGFGPVPGRARRFEFAADDELPAEPLIPGPHNRENAAAATAAARAAGIDDAAVAAALRTFAGVEHRLEPVRELNGVRFVNDSKATNTAAARRGVAAHAGTPLHVIVGGSLKGESFRELAEALVSARSVHVIGEAADAIAASLDEAGVSYDRDGDLATAVASAARQARPGEVVLLSPACASFDQFRDFEHRGEEFRRLAANLQGCGQGAPESSPTS